ncbi:MAG: YdcF family protein [Planctomycetes bacterium]|nr:YdcF family protein [Planctomycetota bacterium]
MAPARRSRRRRIAVAAAIAFGSAAALLLAADRVVAAAGRGRIAEDPTAVAPADVALVLGTGPLHRGAPNPFFEARLDAAAALFRAGTVRGILVSGDHGRIGYDEPTAMRDGLVARGVPAACITRDFAGFSTLDSVLRAGPVFGLRRVVIVSQRFHLERALYLARSAGLDARGIAAADAPAPWQARVRAREALARAKAVAEVALGTGPRFLGPRETVALAARDR